MCSTKKHDKNGHLLGFVPHTYFCVFGPFTNIFTSSSGPQPPKGTAEVDANISVADQGGIRCPDFGKYLRGGGSGVHALRVVDVGNDTKLWEGFGRIPPRGGPQA